MTRVVWSRGGCLQLSWLGGNPRSGWGSSPRRRSCPGNYLPWCIEAASGGAGGAQSVATPQANMLQGSLLTSIPGWLLCWHGVSKGIHIYENTGEDARPLWPLREEQKAPWWSPGTFFPSAPLPTTAAPDSGCSQCPGKCWPSASSQPHCHFVQAGTGDNLGKWCGQSLGGSSVPGGCSRALGGDIWQDPSWHRGLQPFLCLDLLSLCSRLCPRHSPWPSALGPGGISQQLHNVHKLKKNKSKVRIPPFQPGTSR